MPLRPAPHLALVCCSLVSGTLALLAPAGTDRRHPQLPAAPLPASGSLDDTARALARETLGRAPAWMAQVGAFNEEGGLALAFVALVPAGTEAPDGMAWVPFPRQPDAILRATVALLRDRLDRDPIAFRLLPATFTLTDLQEVYELLLERRLHKASFRRTLLAAHLVEPTEAWRSEGRGRPAQLFRFSPRRRRGVQRAVRFELLG
jgi:8-oxo-dGTP diphosphatase